MSCAVLGAAGNERKIGSKNSMAPPKLNLTNLTCSMVDKEKLCKGILWPVKIFYNKKIVL